MVLSACPSNSWSRARTRSALGAIALAAALAACGRGGAEPVAQTPHKGAGPVETRAPNGRGQASAFEGQTRARQAVSNVRYETQVLARGLDHPWALGFLPDGRMLVSERAGRIRLFPRGGGPSLLVAGVPQARVSGQGGLMDLEVDPDFARTGLVYFSYFEDRGGGQAGMTVARARLEDSAGAVALREVQTLFRALPADADDKNLGCRIVFLRDGTLAVTVGDRFGLKDLAQRLDNHLGKVIRINRDGSIPRDNPFVGRAGARPEIYDYGHRNPEAAAVNPWTGALWTVEHGPRGGDELNIEMPGANYGWPVISYGVDYSGLPIGRGITRQDGMEQPVYYWDPVIAPSGMAFYTADLFPAWQGSLFVGSLKEKHLDRLTLEGGRVIGEERLLVELGARIRDVRQGPDGALYVVTDEADGRVIRVAPPGH